jgi:hypothetical protein
VAVCAVAKQVILSEAAARHFSESRTRRTAISFAMELWESDEPTFLNFRTALSSLMKTALDRAREVPM